MALFPLCQPQERRERQAGVSSTTQEKRNPAEFYVRLVAKTFLSRDFGIRSQRQCSVPVGQDLQVTATSHLSRTYTHLLRVSESKVRSRQLFAHFIKHWNKTSLSSSCKSVGLRDVGLNSIGDQEKYCVFCFKVLFRHLFGVTDNYDKNHNSANVI